MATGFLGMRGNGDWVTDQRPLNWRQQILYLYPNGMAPLTAILSMMGSSKVDDPQFHWWTQDMGSVQGAVSGVYTKADGSAAYVSGGVAGDIIYIQVLTTDANKIRPGHQILLRDASDDTVDVNGKVVNVTRGTTNSILSVMLLEADDNSSLGDLSDCDNFKIIGNINPEGGQMPQAVALNPTKVYNFTQIFRTSMMMTRTAMNTHLRTGDQKQKMKSEALEMHSWEMELAFIFGIKTERTGDNGKPERTTGGILEFIKTYASANVDNYALNADYTGLDWATAAGGGLWLDTMLEQIFRYGSSERLALCGSGALLGLQRLVTALGTMYLEPVPKVYGMDVRRWVTPFGSIYFKTHPLFSYDVTTRNSVILLEPKELGYRYITDTQYIPYKDSAGHLDGDESEFKTECGLEFGLAEKCAYLTGFGVDNELS